MSSVIFLGSVGFLLTGIAGAAGFALVEHWLPEDGPKRHYFRIFAMMMFLCVLFAIFVIIQPTIQGLGLFFALTAVVTGGSFRLASYYASEIDGWINNAF